MRKPIFFFMLFFLLISFIFINSKLLFISPAVWPDEAEYADGALNLISEHRLFSNIWYNIGNYQKGIFWYPPLFFYYYALLFKVFGFSIETIRFASFITGGLFLIVYFYFSRYYIKHLSFLLLLPMSLTIIDQDIMDMTRIGRPEIYIITLTVIALLFIIHSKKYWSYFISGILIAISIVTHFGGIIGVLIIPLYILYKDRLRKAGLIKLLVFILPIIIALIWWLRVINFDFKELIYSLYLQHLKKESAPNFFQSFTPEYFFSAMISLVTFIGSLFAVLYFIVQRKVKNNELIILGVLVCWTYIFFAGGDSDYVLPFLYLAYSIIFMVEIKNIRKHPFGFISIILIIMTTLSLKAKPFITNILSKNYSYNLYGKSIARNIPDGSKVLISALPDPYFELRKNKTLTIMHFLSIPGYKEEYLQALNEMDYIIFNTPMDLLLYKSLVYDYGKVNQRKIDLIYNGPGQYHTFLITLKPKSERKTDFPLSKP